MGPPICEMVTQTRSGLLGSTAMQLMKRGVGEVRSVLLHAAPVQLTFTIRPSLVPIRMLSASIGRMADAASLEASPREKVAHGPAPVLVTTSEFPPMATVDPDTSTGG